MIPQHTLSDDTTDLIPGVYEGGLKVWECSVDLCRFLASVIERFNGADMDVDKTSAHDEEGIDFGFVKDAVKRAISFDGTTLELGCGHGLPGCLILRENIRETFFGGDLTTKTSKVVFTDFNDFVLQHATIPNAQINVSGLRHRDGASMDECRTAQSLQNQAIFVGGDWMGLSNKMISSGDNDRFDLILAAETTYTTDSCNDTAFLMAKHLKVGTGVGLVATKRFYFGVGGGTDMLSNAIKTINSSNMQPFLKLKLLMRTIKSYDTGNANIRDLIEIRLIAR